jgi:RDD family protein
MPCPLCGDICRCSSDTHSAASPRWLADDDTLLPAAPPHDEAETPGADVTRPGPAADAVPPDSKDGDQSAAREDSAAWRQEIAARLNRYQSRRKPRPPRYPSLQLHFEEDPPRTANDISAASTLPYRVQASNQALALDRFADGAEDAVEVFATAPVALPEDHSAQKTAALPHTVEPPQPAAPASTQPASPNTGPVTGKILEFPRSWTPPPAPFDELAEPVIDRGRPRILEAPEVVPPPPALGGITIETAERTEAEKRPGIDIPLQSAPLARRIFAAAVDGAVIAAACTLFAFIFWKLAAIRPPRLEIMGLVAGLSGLFWAVYQYLLVVYSGTTPGLRLTRLELTRFDGSPASRRLRRWRVLASFLSAASLGMGYAWVFLDEDSLCWHDRITHTYLSPRVSGVDEARRRSH